MNHSIKHKKDGVIVRNGKVGVGVSANPLVPKVDGEQADIRDRDISVGDASLVTGIVQRQLTIKAVDSDNLSRVILDNNLVWGSNPGQAVINQAAWLSDFSGEFIWIDGSPRNDGHYSIILCRCSRPECCRANTRYQDRDDANPHTSSHHGVPPPFLSIVSGRWEGVIND